MKIEVGMMVEIVDSSEWKLARRVKSDALSADYIGRIGEVVSLGPEPAFWVLAGDSFGSNMFPTENLRPIKDDDASWDNEVWEKLNWQPPVEVTCE